MLCFKHRFGYTKGMRQSALFTKTRKEAPADETAKNAELLIRGGFIHKEMAGVYDLLPLGLRVIQKIKKIVSEEMEDLGSSEILMSTIQNKEIWEKTDRWSDEKVDIWFKSALKSGTEIGFGWSHEEPITAMMRSHIASYSDLPRFVHQFQNKLRNETRAKSGIMRCREFIMKDMYSYAVDEAEHMDFYNKATDAYMNVYQRLGLGDITYITSASGGVFTDKFSHEFQTICEAGEDMIYVHKDKKLALNAEIFNTETLEKLGKKKEDFEEKKTAEVGNIFTFGTGKCEELDLYYTDKDGTKKGVFLGSYGIGVTRLMGVIAEIFSDEKGLIWPKEIAPYRVHLVLVSNKEEVKGHAEEIYKTFITEGVEVLFDDRDARAGEKFADSDLIGIPTRIVIGDKTAGGMLEVKDRRSGVVTQQTIEDVLVDLKK
jgi:prolyl-tRNA synthetase